MTHHRKLIRDEIITRLTDSTEAGDRVYRNAVFKKFNNKTYPFIVLRTIEDDPKLFNESPPEYKRGAVIAIDIYVIGNESIDDDVDMVAAEVEEIMAEANGDYLTPPGGEALLNNILLGPTRIKHLSEGEFRYSVASIAFVAEYYQVFHKSSEGLDDLETVNVKMNLSGKQAAGDQNEDMITGLAL